MTQSGYTQGSRASEHAENGRATTDKVRIAAVVVTYNRCNLLLQCIRQVRAQQLLAGVQLDVLVIDNASTDNTVYELAEYIESGSVLYYNTGSNLGGAGGFAFGMKAAVEAGYDLLWVMDDDCLPKVGALATLLEAAQQRESSKKAKTQDPIVGQEISKSATATSAPSWGFLSSVAYWTDGSLCAMNIQRHPLYSNIKDFSPALQPCTLASFVSLLVPAAVVREVGLPIAEFFIWTDDWEFTRRISRRYPSYVVGTSQVVHASATNNPGNIYTDPPERLDRYAYIYRNDGVLYTQEGLRGKAFLIVRAIYHSLRVLLNGVGEKKQRLSLIWNGTREGFSFHPEVQYPARVNVEGD